jgi:hypothetical protein
MLSLGIDMSGQTINLEGLADPACIKVEGIPNSETLIRFVDALMDTHVEALNMARDILVNEMGAEAMVDVVGVASHFQRMDRIADGTGIPLEWLDEEDTEGVLEVSKKINAHLSLNDFQSAANTLDTS